MYLRRRLLAVVIAVGAAVALGAAGTANAVGESGQTISAGDSVCSDQVRSDNGVRLTGDLMSGTGEWTVRRAGTAGGTETVVFRSPAGSPSGQPVPVDKTVTTTGSTNAYYRACLHVDKVLKYSVFSIANYRMSLTSTSATAVDDIGPDTAMLSASAEACGDRTAVAPGDTVRLAGTSTGLTQWIIVVTGQTNNYEGNWEVLLENAGDIDRTVTLDPEITQVTVCALGYETAHRVSVGFELSVV